MRPALILGCGIAIFTQLSGIEMIIYYSPTILTDNGFSDSVALQVSVALGVSYLVAQTGRPDDHRQGRPPAADPDHDSGCGAEPIRPGHALRHRQQRHGNVPFIIACLVVFMLFNAGGLQLMGWLTGSETYPLAVRGQPAPPPSPPRCGAPTCSSRLTLLTLISGIGVGPAMWLYGLFNVAAWIFVYFRMPDLTGKSLEEIEGKLSDGKFRPPTSLGRSAPEPTA